MTKYLAKINQIAQELAIEEVDQRIIVINQTVNLLLKKQVPKKQLPYFAFLPDELANLQAKFSRKKQKLAVMNQLLANFRQYLSLTFGIWSLPNLTTAKLIKEEFKVKTALEVMAGNALWSKALSDAGIKMVATDSLEWAKSSATGNKTFYPVENLTAVEALKQYPKFDLIICSWAPNFGKNDIDLIRCWQKYSQSRLIFVGEKLGATNSTAFWYQTKFAHSEQIERINRSFVSYDFINEKIFEIKKI